MKTTNRQIKCLKVVFILCPTNCTISPLKLSHIKIYPDYFLIYFQTKSEHKFENGIDKHKHMFYTCPQ